MTNGKRIALGGIVIAACLLLGSTPARASWCAFCGSNSATVGDGVVFDELNSQHLRKGDGPRVGRAFLADGTEVTLKVRRHFLSAVAGKRTYTGQELVGMIVNIDLKDGRAYQLKLVTVWDGCRHTDNTCDPKRKVPPCNRLTFWVSPFEEVPYYDFQVRKTSRRTGVGPLDPDDPKAAADPRRGPDRPLRLNDPSKPGYRPDGSKGSQNDGCGDCKKEEFKEHLCKGELHADDELWSTHRETAIVFEGDRYDPDNKTVSEMSSAAVGWFNLACAGTAPYKMHMLRHTKAGSVTPDGTPRNTTIPQRTAMLKAITADYCGDGRSWTGDGTKLWWTDAQGWFPNPMTNIIGAPDSKGIEAIWGPNGVLCLNAPRRLPEPPAPLSTYPACDAPSVERTVVESICHGAKKVYAETPPGPGKAPATSSQIPKCDAAWADWWAKQAGKSPTAATPYVLSVNREKHADAVKYCNPPGVTAPP
jgi:ADYC domain-containing protein